MSENKNPKRRGITLNEPKDARRLIRRVVDRAFAEGQELEYSGRIAQLLGIWAKLWEIDKLSDIEARIVALEQAKDRER
ncbi:MULTISPECIES: hypothetical protein [Methanothrix]|jgi:hypothetical protein|uniref:hypothetical protein n=1 Tax=Methanothrix TaxID=2222 RepID=UPI0009D43E88|nr:hypothetical protein [Euryarchaeota archaeon]OPY56198.1 MAG: hypothetical protein A4E49_00285 [Methanosaeta sp. PtaU1.Bin112]